MLALTPLKVYCRVKLLRQVMTNMSRLKFINNNQNYMVSETATVERA